MKETIQDLKQQHSEAIYKHLLPTWTGNGKNVRCFAHEDNNPSLSIFQKAGEYRHYCHSCKVSGDCLDLIGSFENTGDATHQIGRLKEIAGITETKKKIEPLRKQHSLSLADIQKITFDGYSFDRLHTYKAGNPPYIKVLFKNSAGDKKGLFYSVSDNGLYVSGRKSEPVFYNQERITDNVKSVFISESEKDCDTLLNVCNFLCISTGGATSWSNKLPIEILKDKAINLLPHHDQPGRKYAEAAAQSLRSIASSIKIIELPGLCDKGDISDYLQARQAEGLTAEVIKTELRQLVKAASEWQAPEATAEPEAETDTEPLERQGFPEMPFPMDILPEPFGRLTSEYARALQVKPEVMAMCFMTTLSGAIGNSVTLKVKTSWEIAPFLWFAIIGTTGTGKSHAAEKVMKPVKYLQAKESKRHKELEQDYKKELANYKAKSGEYPPEPPDKRHYWTANFTIEALIPMYQADARGLIIYVDELAGLIKGLNQYKSSGNDKENLISLFNATDLKSDRKTGSGESNNSGAAVIGGIQPAIINTVFRDTDFNNGLIYRFLPLIVEHTPQKFSLDSINETSEDTWQRAVNWMYEIPLEMDTESGKILPHTLTLDPEALEAWRVFHDRYSQSEVFVSVKFRGFLPKLRGYCLKFMAVLHVMEGYQNDALSLIVSKDTVISAIRLTDYFAGQALKLVSEQSEEKNPYHFTIIKALNSLHGEVTSGKILLNKVRAEVNKLLPADMQIDPSSNKRLSTWLKEMGFTVEPGAHGYNYLKWDSEKISYEFSSLSSLSSPTSTAKGEQSEQSEQFSGKIK